MSAGAIHEDVLEFACSGLRLWGILSRPVATQATPRPAVLIVTGGPQYRVGSHRMFVSLGRRLAGAGHPTLRFDYVGMGDSDGERKSFDAAGDDLRAALEVLLQAQPSAPGVVVWGLCDAASAALMFLAADERVVGIVAANPWARSDASLAAVRVKHYYTARLLQRDFWRKLLAGGLDWRGSLSSLWRDLRGTRSRDPGDSGRVTLPPFQQRMADGLRALRGPLLLLMSGNDLTAREFAEYAAASPAWRGLLQDPKVQRVDLPDADHTFSQRRWLERVLDETLAWLEGVHAGAARSLRRSTAPREGNP